MLIIFFLISLGFGIFILIQYKKHCKVNKLYNQAKKIERQYPENPYNTSKLKEALSVYKQCNKITHNSTYSKAIAHCQNKIDDCFRFQSLINSAKHKCCENNFKRALPDFIKAEKLFTTNELINEINKCHQGIIQENRYEEILEQCNQKAIKGEFQTAINLLIPTVEKFPRQDGQQLLNKLRLAIRTKDLYQLGLIAEHKGLINEAIASYKQALDLVPEYIDCKLRLAIVTAINNPQQAINCLQNVSTEQAFYLRGFASAQLKKWQQAQQEWEIIEHPQVLAQKNIIKEIIKRDRLIKIQVIEELVKQKQIKSAQSLSFDFIKEYDYNSTVKNNLENYINPVLEHQLWANNDWEKITTDAEKIWLEQQDIKSLHNWAIATYYQAQVNPNKLNIFIIAWLTALANIQQDTSLKDVPWLGSNSINLQDISHRLKQIVEHMIDGAKDENIEEYLKLRDIYRRDIVMLSLSQKSNCGIKTKSQLVILPNYYQHFKKYLPQEKFPIEVWGALYTDWGIAIAACHKGDIARGIKIKPHQNPSSEIEHFAHAFISYHEGCYYLQNQDWREAIKSLQSAKTTIINKSSWCNDIDLLCEIQQQQIGKIKESLEFSKSWYLLIGSQKSKAYYVEYQSMQIGLDVDNNKIDIQQALNKLRDIQQIDPDNSVAFDIIATLEINLAIEKINLLWQQNKYEEAVAVARRSYHQKVRFAVAEVCLEIVLEILQRGSLTSESIKSLQQITQWAYELCPDEPLFQSTYSQLKQLGIHH